MISVNVSVIIIRLICNRGLNCPKVIAPNVLVCEVAGLEGQMKEERLICPEYSETVNRDATLFKN